MPSLQVRSRSPPVKRRRSGISFGCRPEQLRLIRLTSTTSSQQLFEIRRNTFPDDEPIQVKAKNNSLAPIPTDKINVLKTANSNVIAILHDFRCLRGIYTRRSGYDIRLEITMDSSEVKDLPLEEEVESPFARKSTISNNFRIVNVDDYSLQY